MFGILCTGNSPIKHTKESERRADIEQLSEMHNGMSVEWLIEKMEQK